MTYQKQRQIVQGKAKLPVVQNRRKGGKVRDMRQEGKYFQILKSFAGFSVNYFRNISNKTI
jgi:hypothetical protein